MPISAIRMMRVLDAAHGVQEALRRASLLLAVDADSNARSLVEALLGEDGLRGEQVLESERRHFARSAGRLEADRAGQEAQRRMRGSKKTLTAPLEVPRRSKR